MSQTGLPLFPRLDCLARPKRAIPLSALCCSLSPLRPQRARAITANPPPGPQARRRHRRRLRQRRERRRLGRGQRPARRRHGGHRVVLPPPRLGVRRKRLPQGPQVRPLAPVSPVHSAQLSPHGGHPPPPLCRVLADDFPVSVVSVLSVYPSVLSAVSRFELGFVQRMPLAARVHAFLNGEGGRPPARRVPRLAAEALRGVADLNPLEMFVVRISISTDSPTPAASPRQEAVHELAKCPPQRLSDPNLTHGLSNSPSTPSPQTQNTVKDRGLSRHGLLLPRFRDRGRRLLHGCGGGVWPPRGVPAVRQRAARHKELRLARRVARDREGEGCFVDCAVDLLPCQSSRQ